MIKVIRNQIRSGNKKCVVRIFSQDLWIQHFQFRHRRLNFLNKVHGNSIIEVKTTNLGWINDGLYSLRSDMFKQKQNIQSDHQHAFSSVNAAENYHPINFFLRCSNPGLGSPLANKSPSCSVVEFLSNLIPCFKISPWNQIVFVW